MQQQQQQQQQQQLIQTLRNPQMDVMDFFMERDRQNACWRRQNVCNFSDEDSDDGGHFLALDSNTWRRRRDVGNDSDVCPLDRRWPMLMSRQDVSDDSSNDDGNDDGEIIRTPLHEHPLQQVNALTLYGGQGFGCGNCRRTYNSPHRPFHCSQCNFDLCHLCASGPARVYTNNITEKKISLAVKKQSVVSVQGAPLTSRPPPTSLPPPTPQPPSTSRLPLTSRPAEVFISYQWGSQGIVLELKQRLEKNGIYCWMDTSQMGGGDALFAEIDAGISAAKVVICCVTQKYCQSESCQREATLADSRKKPIIPLLFEDITWPPAGQLALVFAKLLYIKMVPGLEAVHSNKFKEILQKIQCHVSK